MSLDSSRLAASLFSDVLLYSSKSSQQLRWMLGRITGCEKTVNPHKFWTLLYSSEENVFVFQKVWLHPRYTGSWKLFFVIWMCWKGLFDRTIQFRAGQNSARLIFSTIIIINIGGVQKHLSTSFYILRKKLLCLISGALIKKSDCLIFIGCVI